MRLRETLLAIGIVSLATAPRAAEAQVSAVGAGFFSGAATTLTFTGLTDGEEVNGLTVSGVGFGYSLGDGHVILDGGPGVTNNISPLNIVSVGNPSGILSFSLPGLWNNIGFGFALLYNDPLSDALSITLFNGATNLGMLFFDGAPDPAFTGGFAGIQSVTPFDRVEVAFNEVPSAWALDNIVSTETTVPEPTTMALLATGLVGVMGARRKRRAK